VNRNWGYQLQKNIKNISWLVLLVAILLSACSAGDENSSLSFEGAWVRAMPPGMKMTAGFGRLRNSGSGVLEISAYSSPSFGDVSLHRTELVDGISKMREVGALAIDPDGEVMLEPGGYHLMLMMPTGDIQPGQIVRLEMESADGRRFSFDMRVERR
jgi:copper(I)-binding protein